MYKSNKQRAVRLLWGCLLSLSLAPFSHAQRDQRLLLIGVSPGLGIGIYNSIGVVGGIDLRYQHPLARNLTLTAKTGIDVFRIKNRYAEQVKKDYQTITGFSVPVTVGPRCYFLKGMYGGLNLGADIGISKLTVSSFRFEPMVGVVIPTSAGRYVDVGASIQSSFNRGSGIFSFNLAYGLGWAR